MFTDRKSSQNTAVDKKVQKELIDCNSFHYQRKKIIMKITRMRGHGHGYRYWYNTATRASFEKL